MAGAICTVGISVLLGNGNIGFAPIPADMGCLAISPHAVSNIMLLKKTLLTIFLVIIVSGKLAAKLIAKLVTKPCFSTIIFPSAAIQ